MRPKQCRQFVTCSVAAWCTIAAAIATAQDARNHIITVSGRGKVKVAPTSVELMGTISGDAELAGDALTKFRGVKEAAVNAIKKLGLQNLTMETSGLGIGPAVPTDTTSQILLRSRGAAPEPPKVLIQESVRIRLGQIDTMDRDKLTDTMVKIIDIAKESGVTFGSPPGANRISINRDEFQGFATFMIDDPQEVREQAEAQAMQDARAKAERLVKLAGGQLGEVVSLQETQQYISPSLRPMIPEQSPKLDEIEITATLQVQFKLIGEPTTAK